MYYAEKEAARELPALDTLRDSPSVPRECARQCAAAAGVLQRCSKDEGTLSLCHAAVSFHRICNGFVSTRLMSPD